MFRVTVVNFEPATGQASSEIGSCSLGEIGAAELLDLFTRLRAVDPIQNVEAEPEIRIEIRRQRYVVYTGQQHLYFHEAWNAAEPARVLLPEQIIGELDGTAAAARKQFVEDRARGVKTAPAVVEPPRAPKRPPMPPKVRRAILTTVLLTLSVYVAEPLLSATRDSAAAGFEPISDPKQLSAYQEDLAGVYMSGSQPGHYGIALSADGTMKFFQLNARGIPGVIRDTFRVGRIDGRLCVMGSLPGGPMVLVGKHTISYSGETFERLGK